MIMSLSSRVFDFDFGKQMLQEKDLILEKLTKLECEILENWHNYAKEIIPINMAKNLLIKTNVQLLELNFNQAVRIKLKVNVKMPLWFLQLIDAQREIRFLKSLGYTDFPSDAEQLYTLNDQLWVSIRYFDIKQNGRKFKLSNKAN